MSESTQQASKTTAAAAAAEMRPYSKRQQLLQELMGDRELLLKNRLEVRHLMTRSPVVVSPAATFDEMHELMQERRLHHLLVCSRAGELVGVVSDRDMRATHGATAQQLMSYPALSCTSDTPVTAAITYLMNENISCLPVVDGGRLCGVLTTTDLVLTLQCTLQLWLRLAQVMQHDSTWSTELDKIAGSLDGDLTAAELAERLSAARRAIREEVQNLINVVDLHADALTGVGSRRELDEVLHLLVAVHKRHKRPFSVVLVAIDHFERIRESCGDVVVKPLLKAVARLIEQTARESDTIARYRDDAFAVVLAETRLGQAGEFCRRLHEAADKNAEVGVKLRISTGAAEAAEGEDVETLLRRAEAAVQ